MRPYRLRENHMGKVIEELYSSELETRDKKNIVNIAIGCSGKKYNRKNDTKVFNCYDAAVHHLGGQDAGRILAKHTSDPCQFNMDDEADAEVRELLERSMTNESFADITLPTLRCSETLFLARRKSQATLRNGFYPIQHLIYDTTRHDMFELAKRCEEHGAIVCAIRTDCLYLSNTTNESVAALTNYNDADSAFDSIGAVRCDKMGDASAMNLPNKCVEGVMNYLVEYTTDDCNVYACEREKEWRTSDDWQQDVFAELDKHDRVFVKGVTAGSGKTTTILRYIHRIGKLESSLFAFPDNATVAEMKQKCEREFGVVPRMMTAHKLLGVAFDEKLNEMQQSEASLDGVDIVVLDEVYKHDLTMLLRIRNFMQRNSAIKFIGAGDVFQLDPIGDEFNNVADTQLYRERAVAKMFGKNEVYMQCSKRFESVEDARAVEGIKHDLFHNQYTVDDVIRKYKLNEQKFDEKEFDTSATCITLSNWTRRKVAHIINNRNTRERNDCITVADTRARGTSVTSDKTGYSLRYHAGMRIISKERIKCKEGVIQKNFVMTIVAINEDTTTLNESLENATFIIPTFKLKDFTIENSRTGYSIQGATIEGKVCIFDIESEYASRKWFYTAITRARRLSDVIIYRNASNFTEGYIYRIDCKEDGKFYIGSTTRTPEQRIREHFTSAHHGSDLRLHQHIREKGNSEFTYRVLHTISDISELRRVEEELIATLKPELNMRAV